MPPLLKLTYSLSSSQTKLQTTIGSGLTQLLEIWASRVASTPPFSVTKELQRLSLQRLSRPLKIYSTRLISTLSSRGSRYVVLDASDNDLNHSHLIAHQPGLPFQGGVDKAISLAFDFNGTNFFINNSTFVPPTVPVLLQIISGAQSAQDLLPAGSVYELPRGASIELNLPATSSAPGAPHPFHLHGVSFDRLPSL